MAFFVDKTTEGRWKLYFPHHHLIPKGDEDHVRYRQRIYQTTNKNDRKELLRMCAEDPLFYLNSFVYIFQAQGDPKPVPFNTYPFQDEALFVMHRCVYDGDGLRSVSNPRGQEDCRIRKPRKVGATWLAASGIVEHGWHFGKDRHYLIGSRNQNELDRGSGAEDDEGRHLGEWARFFPKFDFIHLHQPYWVWPPGYKPCELPYRKHLSILNPHGRNAISGESASKNFGRSGRYFVIVYDELAATQNAGDAVSSCSSTSFCHFWISTPGETYSTFAALGRSAIKQISLDWMMHPEYSTDASQKPDGRWTSPWYEQECARLGNDPVRIARELDADEEMSGGGPYYPSDIIKKLRGMVRAPVRRVEFDVVNDQEGIRVRQLIDRSNGRWMFWFHPGSDGLPPRDTRYFIAVDVAAGTRDIISNAGASNSVIAVVSQVSGMKIAQWVGHGVPAHKLAIEVIAAAKYFRGNDPDAALVIYETNGPGDVMGDCIRNDHGFQKLWYDKLKTKVHSKKTGISKPGFHKVHGENGSAKRLFGTHLKLLYSGRYLETDAITVEEMIHYVSDEHGAAVHGATKMKDDPSGARDNHGDRVIPTAMLCMLLDEIEEEVIVEPMGPAKGSYNDVLRRRENLEREAALI